MRTLVKAMIATAILTAVTGTGTAAHACDGGFGGGCDGDGDLLIAVLLSGDRGF
jgi:hypothetical protein